MKSPDMYTDEDYEEYNKYLNAQDAQAETAWELELKSQNTINRVGNTPSISRPEITLPKVDDLPF